MVASRKESGMAGPACSATMGKANRMLDAGAMWVMPWSTNSGSPSALRRSSVGRSLGPVVMALPLAVLPALPDCENLIGLEEEWRDNGRHVGERQHFFRQIDAQHVDHEIPALLATGEAIRIARLQVSAQGRIGENDSVLHPGREIGRRR